MSFFVSLVDLVIHVHVSHYLEMPHIVTLSILFRLLFAFWCCFQWYFPNV